VPLLTGGAGHARARAAESGPGWGIPRASGGKETSRGRGPRQGLRINVETQICLKSQVSRQENRC
jgi:hypothetical protein